MGFFDIFGRRKKKATLSGLDIEEVSTCMSPANQGGRVVLAKMEKNSDLPSVIEPISEEEEMDLKEIQKTLDDVQEIAKKALFLASLTDSEKTHYSTLADEQKAAFEKMSAEDRAKELAKSEPEPASKPKPAKDPDETFKMGDDVIRKSEVGQAAFNILKAQQDKLAKAEADLAKAEADKVQKDLELKVEAMLPNLPGSVQDKADLVKDATDVQIAMLKAANEAMGKQFKEIGQSGTNEDDPKEKLDKLAASLAKESGMTKEAAYTEVLKTAEGKKLYDQV